MAGITQPLHPHLFRHQMLTYLTSKGLSDAQIRLISGHLWNAFHNCSAATQTPTPTEFTGRIVAQGSDGTLEAPFLHSCHQGSWLHSQEFRSAVSAPDFPICLVQGGKEVFAFAPL